MKDMILIGTKDIRNQECYVGMLSLPRVLIYFKHISGGAGGIFNLAKTMVSVLHEELL